MKIKIAYGTGKRVLMVEMEATAVEGAPGLAVHGVVMIDEEGKLCQSSCRFNITHIPSGRAVGNYYFPSEERAIKAANGIKNIADWTKSMHEHVSMGNWYTEIAPKVKAVLEAQE
ncbi:MAG: hypothetical protein PHT33_06885 [bacterium]|nr:hypothetical protein [bacterium]